MTFFFWYLLLCVAVCDIRMIFLVLLVSPVGSILTDPEPLCEGVPAMLTCNVTGGTLIVWRYNNSRIGDELEFVQQTFNDTVGGVRFTGTLLIDSPHLVSQLNFVANDTMNGEVVLCQSIISLENITLQVESTSKYIPKQFPVFNIIL